MITLVAHHCKNRNTYTVKFPTAVLAVAWVLAKQDTHAFDTDFTEDEYNALPQEVIDVLFPTCEHGLSAHLCSGPNHYGEDRDW